MKIRSDQFEAMRTPPWGLRRKLHDALQAMGHEPSIDPASGDLLFKFDTAGPTRVRFGDDGNVGTIEEPGGKVTRAANDDRGRIVALTTPGRGTTRLHYDDASHVTGIGNPDGSSQEIVYRDGKPVEIRRSDRSSVGIAWSVTGLVEGVRDGRGATLGFGYDNDGRLTRVVERGGGETTFKHSLEGRLEERCTPRGAVWRFQTDAMGVGTVTRPDGSHELRYDSGDGEQRFVLADGSLMTLQVDGAGAPTAVSYPDGSVVNLAWAGPGCPTLADNGHHPARFEYDAVGRRTVDEVDGARVEVRYDEQGGVEGITLPTGERLAFLTGPDGRVSQVKDWDGNAYAIEWSLSGAVTGVTYPGHLRERMRVLPSGQLQVQEIGSDGAQIARRYTYDANDLVVQIDDSVRGGKRHQFDADDRLVAVASPLGKVSYAYDADGNMVSGNGRGFEYDALNRITGGSGVRCRCDARGNLVEWEDGKGSTKFGHNAQNQLVRAELPGGRVFEYEYDALGRRIVKRSGGVTTRFVWLGEQILSETTDGPTASRTDYLYLPGTRRPLAMRRDGKVYFYQVDHLDTPVRLFDPAGVVVWEAEPFGMEVRVLSARVRQPLRHPGQYFDDETGLHYNVARYYQPATGRYTTADIPFHKGEANPYPYARNNPAAFVDPSGRNPLLLGALAAAGVGAAIGAGFAAAHQIATNLNHSDDPNVHWYSGVGGAIVHGAIVGAAGGLGAFVGAIAGFCVGGPVGAVAGGIIGGFVGAGAAAAGIAGYEAPEGKGWEACKEAAIGTVPFVGSIKRFLDHPEDNHRGRQLAIDLGFDVVGIALIVVGARKGYSAAKAAESAGKTGMGYADGIRQQEYAKDTQQVIIDRASNAAARKYDGKPGYRPKPHDVETLKTAKDGENAGLVVRPENPTPAQAQEIARLQEEGWSFDEQGRLSDPDGNKIHGDYDLQGVYKAETDAQGNKKYTQVDTNDESWRQDYNDATTPGRKMTQHGANDNYKIGDPNDNQVMGRQPGPDEVYKVTDENGNTKVLNSTAEAQQYYDEKGIPWPYDNYE